MVVLHQSTSTATSITLNENPVKPVNKFNCHESIVKAVFSPDEEINKRTRKAATMFDKLKKRIND